LLLQAGAYPVIDFSEYAAEESALQRCQDKLDGKPVETGVYFSGWSLANIGGYLITGFDHSVEKRPEGKELRIWGNSAMFFPEPGAVWVMQDSNGNGRPDDVWHELGSVHKVGYFVDRPCIFSPKGCENAFFKVVYP
jgi:hypothetical protein